MERIPELISEKTRHNQIKVWCEYCNRYHVHGLPEGHRVARCTNQKSPYLKTGYYIKLRRKTRSVLTQ